MKSFSLLLKAVMILSVTAVSMDAMATGCTTQQTPVCYQADINSNPVDKCVANSSLKSELASNSLSTLGSCSIFSIKRIKTYACNAGLRFVKPTTDVCIKLDQNNAVAATCGDSENCVCSLASFNNDTKVNYFNFGIAPYTGSDSPSYIKKTMNASTTSSYTSATAQSGTHILQDGSGLQFNFGSDFYGAEYFVDICIKNMNLNPSRYDLTLTGKLLFTNSIFNTANYNKASSLNNKIDFSCTDTGGAQYAANFVSETPFLNAERNYTKNVPGSRSCAVRHFFKENTKNKIRENSFKKVTFQTDLKVAPTDQSLLNPPPTNFCKVVKSGKNYSCTAWSATSAEDVIASSFVDGNTYTGVCPKTCGPF